MYWILEFYGILPSLVSVPVPRRRDVAFFTKPCTHCGTEPPRSVCDTPLSSTPSSHAEPKLGARDFMELSWEYKIENKWTSWNDMGNQWKSYGLLSPHKMGIGNIKWEYNRIRIGISWTINEHHEMTWEIMRCTKGNHEIYPQSYGLLVYFHPNDF